MGIEFIAETSWHHEGEFDFSNFHKVYIMITGWIILKSKHQ